MLRAFALTAILALSATTAQAGDTSSITVTIGDLNLSHTADAGILADRLQAAATLVCRDATSGQIGVTARHMMRECVSDAVNIALARIASAQTRAVRAHLADGHQALASN